MKKNNQQKFNDKIVCAYLYSITKYGYPPNIEHTKSHIVEMAKLGFSSIELEGIGHKNIEYLHKNSQDIAKHIIDLDLKVPIFCIVLPQMSSFDVKIRKEQLQLFKLGCEVAAELGAEGVLDNGPLPPYIYPPNMPVMRHYSGEELNRLSFPEAMNWKDYWEGMADTYREACDIAKKLGLLFHLHPCEGSLISNTDGYENFDRTVDSKNLRFNLDTSNQFFLKDNLTLSTLRLADKIDYIHISDNMGNKLEHLVPGTGKIYWEGFFEALKNIGFKGKFGIDVGGDKLQVKSLDESFLDSVHWLEEQLLKHGLS